MSSKEGLRAKYQIRKADGRPVEGRYFVLKLDSKDPIHAQACRSALRVYADMIRSHLPKLAEDLHDALDFLRQEKSWRLWDMRLSSSEVSFEDEVERCKSYVAHVTSYSSLELDVCSLVVGWFTGRGWGHDKAIAAADLIGEGS